MDQSWRLWKIGKNVCFVAVLSSLCLGEIFNEFIAGEGATLGVSRDMGVDVDHFGGKAVNA